MPRRDRSPGRFAYEGLDCGDLKRLCRLTDGNLSRHLRILEEPGLVEITKTFRDNRPHTTCRLTAAGRRRFLEYLAVLETVVADAATAARDEAPARRGLVKGFAPA